MTIGAEVLANAKEHWREKLCDMQTMHVDEWDCDVHWKPSTLAQRDRVFKFVAGNSLEGLAESIIQRARDADGKKLFSQANKKDLMSNVDPDVLAKICTAMNEEPETTIEIARKNSD